MADMPTVAIVGASPNPDRYAFQAVQAYRQAGWTVWPVHPKAEPVDGLPAFRDLAALPGRPDIVCLYVNPAAAEAMLPAILATGTPMLWLNPGTESDTLIAAARTAGLRIVAACTLVVLGRGMDPRQAVPLA
jgi:predicted CoA-binding protein